ncbi:MAG TPA: amidohydrolase family protein, partial [Acidimicrobiales bacterium]|nr:amidohydrolase family protein [Acidimicrobiales bacterium]
MHELIIRGGTVVDGTGAEPRTADVAIDDGVVTAVGRVDERGHREIDADGLAVLPGWVDVHTHYDGQATWDPLLTPTAWHGVTTAVFGNCSVGFAPVRPGTEPFLINLMEGVEDIPGTVLAEGVDFRWESFGEYLDALESMPRALDIGAQVPHAALRFYVMGERGADHAEVPTADEIGEMGRLTVEALRAGALGFSTSRTKKHRAADGRFTPSLTSGADELLGIAEALGAAGLGVLQANSDFGEPVELELLRRMGE